MQGRHGVQGQAGVGGAQTCQMIPQTGGREVFHQKDEIVGLRIEVHMISPRRPDRGLGLQQPVEAGFLFVELEDQVDLPGPGIGGGELGDQPGRGAGRVTGIVDAQPLHGAHEAKAKTHGFGKDPGDPGRGQAIGTEAR